MFDSSGGEKKLIAKPHGEQPLGRVLISPKGWLSAHMARPERMGPLPSGKPWQTGEDKEVAFVARGMSMYCGYLQLFKDDDGLYWETRVEVASDPARVGGLEVRRINYFEEDGKKYMVLQPMRDMLLEVRRSFCPSSGLPGRDIYSETGRHEDKSSSKVGEVRVVSMQAVEASRKQSIQRPQDSRLLLVEHRVIRSHLIHIAQPLFFSVASLSPLLR